MADSIPFSIESYNELVVQADTHVVQMRDGNAVRIACTDFKSRNQKYPVIAIVDLGPFEDYQLYTKDGESLYRRASDNDLVIVPKPPVSLGWVVVYRASSPAPNTTSPWNDKEQLLYHCRINEYELLSEPTQIFAK